MRIFIRSISQILSTLLLAILVACGGGGSNTDSAGITRSGSPATSTVGPISGFGSVIVNGIRYHSDKATIVANDDPATELDLRTGMQVHITGTVNTDGTGDATRIEFFPNIVGTISAKDASNSHITVLGQTVQINNATLFGANIMPNFIDGLAVGDRVQVSGFLTAQNNLIATRIDLTNINQYRVLGKISNLDTANATFSINSLVVSFSGAQQKDFDNNNLTNNQLVFVRGNTLNGKNELVAQQIKLMQGTLRSGSKHAEISGIVTRFVSLSDFDIGSVNCTTNGTTSFEDGAATDLTQGAQIQVVGDVNANGVLVVSKIRIRKQENAVLAGVVSGIITSNGDAIVTGSFVLDGVTVLVNNLTRVEDKSDNDLKRFNLSDLHDGEFVKVSGYLVGSKMIATHLERASQPSSLDIRIEGFVTGVMADSFNLNDRRIIIGAQTELKDSNGQTLTSTAFLAMAIGKNVEVRGTLVGTLMTAAKVEIKNI